MAPQYVSIKPFEKKFSRKDFDCGQETLNGYLKNLVSQDIRRNLAVCYVMVPYGGDEIIGYYTLSASSVLLDQLPGDITAKLRYNPIPAALLGRLAVDRRYKGEGLGRVLLYDAIERVRSAPMGCYAMIVDAKDEGAKDFYVSFGFEPLMGSPMRLFFVL